MLLRDIRGAGPPEGRGVLGLVEDLLGQTVRLLDQKLTLLRLEVEESLGLLMRHVAVIVCGGVLAGLGLVLASITLALWIGNHLGSTLAGFAITGAGFLVVGAVMVAVPVHLGVGPKRLVPERSVKELRLASFGGLPPRTSGSEDLDLHGARARAIPLREPNGMVLLEGQPAICNGHGDPGSEEAGAEMGRGIPPLAVRPAQIVVAVGLVILNDVTHEPEDTLRPGLRDKDGARRMQAVYDDDTVLRPHAVDDLLHLGPDINGLATGFTGHHEALPVDKQTSSLSLRCPHESASPFAS